MDIAIKNLVCVLWCLLWLRMHSIIRTGYNCSATRSRWWTI